MSGSLLAYLYPHIKGSQEDVATLSLCYIISQSDILRNYFTKMVEGKLQLTDVTSLHYNTQVVGENKDRPDIVGIDENGAERLICEAKFFASLTDNQPNGYLERLKNSKNSGLIFICPESRKLGLWDQLLALVNHQNPKVLNFDCVDINGVRMSIISWKEILDTLLHYANQHDQVMEDDIRQLIGYCNEIESTSFIPFKAEDFGADIAKRIDRYYMVVDSTTDYLMRKKDYNPATKGLRATSIWNGYIRYIRIYNFCIGICFDRSLWKKSTSVSTPFWLDLYNSKWQRDETIINYLNTLPYTIVERHQNGKLYIALSVTATKTLEENAQEIGEQIMNHLFELKKMKPE